MFYIIVLFEENAIIYFYSPITLAISQASNIQLESSFLTLISFALETNQFVLELLSLIVQRDLIFVLALLGDCHF